MKNISKRPRLSVFRSNKYIYAQLIDDEAKFTLVATKSKLNKAEEAGTLLAKKAIAKKIKEVVFDRRRYKYHGHVKVLAEGAKKGGLVF